MSTQSGFPQTQAQPQHETLLDPIRPALSVGAATGTIGLLMGGAAGILRSKTPLLFSIAAGLQCFSLGTSFWYFRGALLQGWAASTPSRRDKTISSTIAGTLAGAANGALRSRANILPGAIVFTGFGFIGQATYNRLEERRAATCHEPKDPFLHRLFQSKWMPMKSIREEDYIEKLEDHLLNLDVEIGLIDEKIEALKSGRPD